MVPMQNPLHGNRRNTKALWVVGVQNPRLHEGVREQLAPDSHLSIQPAMMRLGCYHHLSLPSLPHDQQQPSSGCWARKSSGMEVEDVKMSK